MKVTVNVTVYCRLSLICDTSTISNKCSKSILADLWLANELVQWMIVYLMPCRFYLLLTFLRFSLFSIFSFFDFSELISSLSWSSERDELIYDTFRALWLVTFVKRGRWLISWLNFIQLIMHISKKLIIKCQFLEGTRMNGSDNIIE